ncbi:MAG: hypothetical protein HS114_14025 [Anaerolineales bacterium]|nr:hypothetical protein [Anaerolineales bacterium]
MTGHRTAGGGAGSQTGPTLAGRPVSPAARSSSPEPTAGSAAHLPAIDTAERARRAELQARGLIRRRGGGSPARPLAQAQVEATQAITTFDTWSWLLAEVRQALELSPQPSTGRRRHNQSHPETAITLLQELGQADITTFADDLQQKLPELLPLLAWLEQHLTPLLKNLAADTQAFVLWTGNTATP